MKLSLLNNFHGDQSKEFETTTPDGRAQAAKMVDELLRSGSAVFLEREVNGETYTYRVTGYDSATNKLTIRLDSSQVQDAEIEHVPRRKGSGRPTGIPRRSSYGRVSPEAGRTVAVAPRSGG